MAKDSYKVEFGFGLDFEKAGACLDDIHVDGVARFFKDGFWYEGYNGTKYHDLGWDVEIVKMDMKAWSERRKAFVPVSERLKGAIYEAREKSIMEQIKEVD